MKYSTQEIRGAILRAADRIERKPASYNFCRLAVPMHDDGGCGTQACMWGWIGFELGMRGCTNPNVAVSCGIDTAPEGDSSPTAHLYRFCSSFDPLGDERKVPAAMRAYADKYFPAVVSAPPLPTPESHQLVKWSACEWRPSGVRA